MTTEQAIRALLADLRTFFTAFGGAMPLDESHLKSAAYGPGGFIERGSAFKGTGDIKELARSYRLLAYALARLQAEQIALWVALVEPYLADPADPGLPGHWKRQIDALDNLNADIRQHNRLVAQGKRKETFKTERVGLTWTRILYERHELAITALAEYLKTEDLYYVPSHRMSAAEAKAGEHTERRMYAAYQRYRVAGNRHEKAAEMAAREFGVPTDRLERAIEFRRDTSADECLIAGCDRAPYANGLCQKHNAREWRMLRRERAG